MKRAVKSLERAGLVKIQSTETHLIVKCVLAKLDKPASNKAEPRPIVEPDTNQAQIEPVKSTDLEVIHKNPNISNTPRGRPTSEVRS